MMLVNLKVQHVRICHLSSSYAIRIEGSIPLTAASCTIAGLAQFAIQLAVQTWSLRSFSVYTATQELSTRPGWG